MLLMRFVMPGRFDSLRARSLILLSMIFAIVLAVAVYRAVERRDSDIAQALVRLQLQAQMITDKQTEVVRHTLRFLTIMTETMEVGDISRSSRCPSILANYIAHDPHLANLLITRADGQVICSATATPGLINLADRAYFPKALHSRAPVIGEAVYGRSTGKWILPFAQAFHDDIGRPSGVLGIAFDLGWVNAEFGRFNSLPNMRMGLVSASGTVLARYPEPAMWVGRNIRDHAAFTQMLVQQGRGTAEILSHDGERRIYVFSRFAETEAGPIYLWLNVPKESITGAADRQLVVALALSLILLLLTLSVAWYGVDQMLVRPVRRLVDAARQLSQGDRHVRSGMGHDRGEIGHLARAFDEMAQALGSTNEVLRLNRALKVIGACNKVLVYAQSEERLLSQVCKVLIDEGDYRMAWVGFTGADVGKKVHIAAVQGIDKAELEQAGVVWGDDANGRGPVGLAIRTGKPQVNRIFANDPGLAPWREIALANGYQSSSAFPLKDERGAFGVLAIYSTEEEPFSTDEERLLTELSDNIAYGVLALRTQAARREAERQLVDYRDHLEALVTERTQALAEALDQAETANRAKSAFLSNMSHELRTPLNAVIGFSRLMAKSDRLSEAERRNVEIINRSGNHLLTLINDVLELSKIEAGHVSLLEGTIDIAGLAADVVDMLQPRAEQAGLQLVLEMENLPASVRGDAVKLRQVLINLTTNAIKFTRQGKVSLSVKGGPAHSGLVAIAFEIRDTGIGIAVEDQEKIFDPFVQLATHAASAGTGLGLPISRQYLRMLGSTLDVESEVDKGSVFRFELALPLVEAPHASERPRGEVIGLPSSSRGKRILIVDDNADARALLLQLLEPLGFVVSEVADGAQSITEVERFDPDLIVMDWLMPAVDGLTATRRIRSLPLKRQPKIVMLTASAFEEERQQALAAGIDDFLRKPLEVEALMAAIERMLDIRFERAALVQSVGTAVNETPLTVDMLAVLDANQRDTLRGAVIELNRTKVNAVLAQIVKIDPQLAEHIQRMTDAFRYKELLELLDDA